MSPGGSFKIKPIGRSERARDLLVPKDREATPVYLAVITANLVMPAFSIEAISLATSP